MGNCDPTSTSCHEQRTTELKFPLRMSIPSFAHHIKTAAMQRRGGVSTFSQDMGEIYEAILAALPSLCCCTGKLDLSSCQTNKKKVLSLFICLFSSQQSGICVGSYCNRDMKQHSLVPLFVIHCQTIRAVLLVKVCFLNLLTQVWDSLIQAVKLQPGDEAKLLSNSEPKLYKSQGDLNLCLAQDLGECDIQQMAGGADL